MSALSILVLLAGLAPPLSPIRPQTVPRIPSPPVKPAPPPTASNPVAQPLLRGVKLSYVCAIKTTRPPQSADAAPTVEDSVATITLAPQQTDTAPGATPVTYDPIKVKGVTLLYESNLYVFGPVRPDGFSPIVSPPVPVVPAPSGSGIGNPLAGLGSFASSNNKGLASKYSPIESPAVNLKTGEIRWTYSETGKFNRFEARGRCA